MNYKLSFWEMLFAKMGYAIIDLQIFKAIAMESRKRELHNDALRETGIAMLDALNEIMDHKESFAPELKNRLIAIYDDVNSKLDELENKIVLIERFSDESAFEE
jgi:hypothetical protein